MGSHDTSGKEGGPWDRMIQVGKRVGNIAKGTCLF